MRILYILHDTSIYSGSSKSFINLSSDLKKQNIDFMVICPNKNGLYKVLTQENILVENLTYKFNTYPPTDSFKNLLLYIPRLTGRLLVNGKAYKDLYKIAIKYQPDIIHTNVSIINIGYKVAKKMNIPHVWHIREYMDLGLNLRSFPNKKSFKKELQSSLNYSICITKGIQNHYKLKAHSTVIYDGVLACNEKHLNPKKQPYFLFAGRLEENKGIKDVIIAFQKFQDQLPDTNIQLWVAGDTNDTAYYNKIVTLAKKTGISSRILFLGMRKDIGTLMMNATALIVPSYWEGFGFITAEAMFNGCLVIGRNTSGTKEQFDNGLELHKKEIALRFNTQEELTTCMKEVITNGIESYSSITQLAQETVLTLYSIEKYTENVFEYYNKIINTVQESNHIKNIKN